MLSAVPSGEDEAPPATDPAAERRSRRWLRVSKAVLVSFLGLAVTAWLVPALTRQWDDRQREHELKAAIVADMASSTARALVGGEAVWSDQPPTKQARKQIGDEWALSALEIEAKLRSYFPSSVVASWEVYSWAVDRFIDARHVSAAAALQDAVTSETRLDVHVSDAAAALLVRGENTYGRVPTFDGDNPTDKDNVDQLERMLSSYVTRYREEYEAQPTLARWPALEKRVLGLEEAVADQILDSDAAGFSTTTRDLVNDLLP
jgi:hypothetical protein